MVRQGSFVHFLLIGLCGWSVLGCSGEPSSKRPTATSELSTPQPSDEPPSKAAPSRAPVELGEELATLHPLLRQEGSYTFIGRFSSAHNFGGWRTNSDIVVYCEAQSKTKFDRCPDTDLQTAWVTEGRRAATLLLPPESRRRTLGLSIQGKATLYVDGKEVAKSDTDAWSLVAFPIPDGQGFVKLGLRATGRSSYRLGTGDKPRPGAAVRWLTYAVVPAETMHKSVHQAQATSSLTPTSQLIYRVHLTEKQSPGQIRVQGAMDGLELAWVEDGTKPALLQRQSSANADVSVYNLDPETRDGTLIVGSSKTAPVPTLTLHQNPKATTFKSNAEEPQTAPAQNVIVFLVDTLRADKLRIYEKGSRVQTPALDKWTDGATRFTAAHTQENWTKPSVATLMSSTMPWQHKATTGDAVLPKRIATMSELLQKEGFYTGFFSANGYVSDKFGFGRGWHTYRNYIREGRKNPAQYVALDVLQWLDKRPKDKRFFLYVHTIDPHVPYRPPSEFTEMYDPEPYRGVVNFRKDATLLENIKVGKIRLRQRDKEQLVALYDGEITYHDVWFGKILEGLQERGLDQNTAMVFTSDHGEEFWDHGSVGHGHNVYEELLHIPMVMRVPGIAQHRPAIDAPMGLVDVAPTMFEALGLERPQSFEGHSQLAKMAGSAPTEQTVTVSGFMDNWRTIVMGDWKLIMKGNLDPRLYHLPSDPTEQTNVVNTHPMLAWSLMQRLGQELGRTAPVANRGEKPKVEKTTIDPQTRAQLKALGYIE